MAENHMSRRNGRQMIGVMIAVFAWPVRAIHKRETGK